jgi:hypothetical protein
MPRGTFKHEDAMQGGFGFQEGYLLITKSVVAIHQFPVNSKTNEQSDAFTALRWTGTKLDAEWNEIAGETNDTTVVIPMRLGMPDSIRPGKLAVKDFDNLDAEPEDLGDEVDTEGNALYLEEGARVNRGWAIMEESLRKCGFKAEISGRGIATDFEGLVAHFKTVEGDKYIAKQGKKKGQEVTPTNLVCDRIHTFPYDKPQTSVKTGAKASGVNVGVMGKPNGATADEALTHAKTVFAALSNEFKKECPADKEIARAAFQKSLTKELMRQKINPKIQTLIMGLAKNDEKLMELAAEMMEVGVNTFAVGEGVITFA